MTNNQLEKPIIAIANNEDDNTKLNQSYQYNKNIFEKTTKENDKSFKETKINNSHILLSLADLNVKNMLESFLTHAEQDLQSDGEIKNKIEKLKNTIITEEEFIKKKTLGLNDTFESDFENHLNVLKHKKRSSIFKNKGKKKDEDKDFIKKDSKKKKISFHQNTNFSSKKYSANNLESNYRKNIKTSVPEKKKNSYNRFDSFNFLRKSTPLLEHDNYSNHILSNNTTIRRGSTFSHLSDNSQTYVENIFKESVNNPIFLENDNDDVPENIRNILKNNQKTLKQFDGFVNKLKHTILYTNTEEKKLLNFNLESSSDSSKNIDEIIHQNTNILNKSKEKKKEEEEENKIKYSENQDEKEHLYRHLLKKLDLVYDTDSEEEDMDLKIHSCFTKLYILPDSTTKIIFDGILFCLVLYSMYIIPYNLAFPEYNENKNKIKKMLICDIIIDFYYILDILCCCITAYTDIIEEKIVSSFSKIVKRYLQGYFFFDIVGAIPINTILDIQDLNFIGNYQIFSYYFRLIYLFKLFRLIKSFKVLLDNAFLIELLNFLNYITGSLYMEKYYRTFLSIFSTFYSFHLFGCIFIFIGKNNSPNWIINQGFDSKDNLDIYIASIYFVCATVFSVGYGDIVSSNFSERFFNVIMLTLGMLIYSWMVSAISNYFMDNDVNIIKYKKNMNLLLDIRITHDNFPDNLYQKIIRHLNYKKDNDNLNYNAIFDNLPVIMRNNLIFEMYKPVIDNLVFFKNIDNQDFILKVILCFKSLYAIKGDILINDGDFVDEIIFVKKGSLAVEFPLPIVFNPKNALLFGKQSSNLSNKEKYNNISILKSENTEKDSSTTKDRKSNLNNYRFSRTGVFMKRKKKKKNLQTSLNKPHVKLIEIRKNEHFGDIIMFLNKRSPLSLRVKSQKAELFLLLKTDAIEISVNYPKIWKKILKNSLHNIQQIDVLINKYLKFFFVNYHKPKKETIEFLKQKTVEKKKSNSDNEEIKKFFEIKRRSQIIALEESDGSSAEKNVQDFLSKKQKSSKNYQTSRSNIIDETSLDEFLSEDIIKNDSPDELEKENKDIINSNNNNKINIDNNINNNIINDNNYRSDNINNVNKYNINEEFKKNEISLKNDFLFKRIKNKFSDLKIKNFNFSIPEIEQNILSKKEILYSPPLIQRVFEIPKRNNFLDKNKIENENKSFLSFQKSLNSEENEKNNNKSMSNNNDSFLNKSKSSQTKNIFYRFSTENKLNNIGRRKSNITNTKKINSTEINSLNAEKIDSLNKKTEQKRKKYREKTANLKKSVFEEPSVNFFDIRTKSSSNNRLNYVHKKSLYKKDNFSTKSSTKSLIHKKSFNAENKNKAFDNINANKGRRKSQWNIINDNIKESGQNLKNPEEFYSNVFSKMINQRKNSTDKSNDSNEN